MAPPKATSTASNASRENIGGSKKAAGAGSRSRQVSSRNSGAGGNSSRARATGVGGSDNGVPQVHINGKNMTPRPLAGRPASSLEAIVAELPPLRDPALWGGSMLPGGINEAASSGEDYAASPSNRKGGKGAGTPKSHDKNDAGGRGGFGISRQQSQLHHHHHSKGPTLPPGMTLADLEKPVTFTLAESSTETLLHIPSICVHKDFAGMDAIKAKNDKYGWLRIACPALPVLPACLPACNLL